MKKNSKTILTTVAFVAIILLAFLIGDMGDNLRAYWRILSSPAILLSDPQSINSGYGGNLNAIVMNTLTTTGISLLIVKFSKTPFEGGVIASIFTIAGFTFIGKNTINVLPVYLGVMLFAKFNKTPLKDSMIALLLASGMGPIFSYLMFGHGLYHLPLTTRLPLAIAGGVIAGFFIPMVAANAIKFHGGYNLYNVGFTMGLLAVATHGILRSFGVHVRPGAAPLDTYPNHTWFFVLVIGLLSLAMIMLAFIYDKNVLVKFKGLMKETGQLPSNFSQISGQPATMLNMGILGLLCLIIITPLMFIWDVPFLSVPAAGIFTIIGFGAFGKHPVNVIPVMAGATIGFVAIYLVDSPFISLLPGTNPAGAYLSSVNVHGYIGAIFFSTTLAPISKAFGWKAGIIAGILHMMILIIGNNFQGGFNLYNNGWMGGFVAATTFPIFMTLKERKKNSATT